MSARNSQRPESRASTTSAVSQNNDGQLSHDTSKSAPMVYMAQEHALLQYQAGISGQPIGQYEALSHAHMGHHAQNVPFPMQTSYIAHDTPYMQHDMTFSHHTRVGSVPIQPMLDLPEDKRRKGSTVTATNDKELREMLAKNEGRPLKDVAQEVIQKERTPMAEKTKQLFAMLWLRQVCKPAKTSVPRNRVYSQYATRCGTERVVPLNPASFGKLVRVIFPGIQTRRLGVRGESKYNYVDLALEEEQPNISAQWQCPPQQQDDRRRSQSTGTQQIDFNNIPRLQADTAVFPTADDSVDVSITQPPKPCGPPSRGRSFLYPDTRGMQPGSHESMTYVHTLRFPPSNIPTFTENEPVSLPAIYPHLPQRTDNDTAEALAALYRTHCTSLIDSIRFCKEKQFFRLYTSFHGTLTVPVQKLFTHPNLAQWIEQCDLVMYRTMVRFVSRLTLQAAPVVVINILNNISQNLHNHISKTFASQPTHVLEAKLRPATVFAGLLHRLIRVNSAAHAAANLLTIDQNREQMWLEWVTMVNPKRVMEAELPDCGYEEVYKIMTTEMRSLLEPLQSPAYQDDASMYSFEADHGGFAQFLQTQTAPPSSSGTSQVSTENVLDRWSAFLSSLPGRFSTTPARTILHCISSVGTAALRDITIMSGISYQHWWVLKIFVDEMALWLAEMGGFLEPSSSNDSLRSEQAYQSPFLENGNNQSHSGSRMSSMGPAGPSAAQDDSSQPVSNLITQPQGGYASQQQQQQQQQQHQHQQQQPTHGFSLADHSHVQRRYQQSETDIDDSGIGMNLMDDDDLTYVKYGVGGSQETMDGIGNRDMRVDTF